jgi:hypothetical protein
MTEFERVAKGAAWLDKEVPGWERKIDLSILQLSSCCDCICGQAMADMLEGYYIDGFSRAMDISNSAYNYEWAKDHGFYYYDEHDLVALEAAWTSLIKERHNTGNFSDAN